MRRLNAVRSGEMVMRTPMFYHNIRGRLIVYCLEVPLSFRVGLIMMIRHKVKKLNS